MTRSGEDPELSILLVADSVDSILQAIRSFGEAGDRNRLEVVVVSRNGHALCADAVHAEGFPRVQTLSVDSDSYDEAEWLAVRAASAPWVVFTVPNAFPQAGFVDAWRAAAGSGDWAVIGPSVSAVHSQNPLSRSAILIFSGSWVRGAPGGTMNSVPGHYSVYHRAAVLELGDELGDLLVAGEQLLVALRRRGCRFLFEPAMRMSVAMPRRMSEFINCLFRNSRIYAHKRRLRWSLFRRLAFGAGMPFAPLVRLPRIYRQVRGAGKSREALRDAPFLLAGLVASAAGESFGYWFGPGKPWRFEPEGLRNAGRGVRPDGI